MSSPREAFEVVIIGGGIAGNALATVLARAGRAVLVLERATVYRDRVRGELFRPWGVAEARQLGLYELAFARRGRSAETTSRRGRRERDTKCAMAPTVDKRDCTAPQRTSI